MQTENFSDKESIKQRNGKIAGYGKPGLLLALGLITVLAIFGLSHLKKAGPTETAEHSKQESPGLNPPAGSTNFQTIKVTVLNQRTSLPVAGAELDYNGSPNRVPLLTDDKGEAILSLVPLSEANQNFGFGVFHTNYSTRRMMWFSDSGSVLKTVPATYTVKLFEGVTIGGLVTDELGKPLGGVRVMPWAYGYNGFSTGTGEKAVREYSQVMPQDTSVFTDEKGFWQATHFPPDLTAVSLDLVRPGGGRAQFMTSEAKAMRGDGAGEISWADLLGTNATLRMKEGYTVHGKVYNSAGTPVSRVKLSAGAGQNQQIAPYIFTNNADGSFELTHWTAPQFAVAAEAEGYAYKTTIFSSTDKETEKTITLTEAKPLRIRVLGEKEEPVKAHFECISWRSRNQAIDWKGETDAKGVVVWTNATEEPATFYVTSTNYPVRAVQLKSGPSETVVRLRNSNGKGITVKIAAKDAESGKVVPDFEVLKSIQWEQSFSSIGKSAKGEFKKEIVASEFRQGTMAAFKLQVRAGGFATWSSEEIYMDEGDQSFEIKLTKAARIEGVVLQPNGDPAEDAKVILAGESAIFANSPDRFYPGQGATTVNTGKDGRFHFDGATDEKFVFISHPTGSASLLFGDLKANSEVRLQPWATVQGVLRIEGKPSINTQVEIGTPPSRSVVGGLLLVYSATTDAEGRFTFTNLPPGNYLLYRMPQVIYGKQTCESHRLTFSLAAGELKKVDYGFGGRTVVGHIESAEQVNWKNDPQVLALKLPPGPTPPVYSDFVDNKDFRKALTAFNRSPEAMEYERKKQQFQVVFDQEGNFKAEDVPPGNYELRIRVTEPPPEPNKWVNNPKELGALVREVQIPLGSTPFDLGSIPMDVKSAKAEDSQLATPVELNAQTFDGKAFSLEQLKGKVVVVVFWAPWSDNSLEKLDAVKPLQQEWAKDPRIALLGVCAGDDTQSALSVTKNHGYDWTQTTLEGTNLVKALAAFKLTSLPEICLIDGEGRLVAQEINVNRLQAIVQRALKKL